jgi:hypothetical protein
MGGGESTYKSETEGDNGSSRRRRWMGTENGSESRNGPSQSKNDMKIPEFLLGQQRKAIMMSANEQEKYLTEAMEFMLMIKSSAVILKYLVKELIDLNNIKQNKFTPNFLGHD